jgi:ribosomal protein L40E
MRCKVCNGYIPEGATHCLDCGSMLDNIIICQRCAAELPARAIFCIKCGCKVINPDGMKPDKPERVGVGTINSSRTESKGTDTEKQSLRRKQIECQRCGAIVPDTIRYCPTCGPNVSWKIEPASSQEVIIDKASPVEKSDALSQCPRCGTIPRGSSRFCHVCGRFLGSDIEDIICPQCGSANILRYARCQYCGADLPKLKSKE